MTYGNTEESPIITTRLCSKKPSILSPNLLLVTIVQQSIYIYVNTLYFQRNNVVYLQGLI